ncbi:hypothetical protein LWC08_06480 [Desulfobaculum bizertense]|uniref:hypothetical protein n=1 Tax=Desulfobaculum bizertense TaxID=376490 RepID=UPI001F3CF2E1|nr:hypothetical protein [Desulfobaculum bizertense]UIJ39214.1 hypothetical protein LWC08_06480 [Desulfobaculum bizertense]
MHGKDIPLDVVREIVSRVQHTRVVDYSPRDGVTCPVCGGRLRWGKMGVTHSLPWSGRVRERYHRCTLCGAQFKSVEEG